MIKSSWRIASSLPIHQMDFRNLARRFQNREGEAPAEPKTRQTPARREPRPPE